MVTITRKIKEVVQRICLELGSYRELLYIACILTVLMFGTYIIPEPVTPSIPLQSSVFSTAPVGDGPSSQCIVHLSFNIIDSGIAFFVCHTLGVLDTYVGSTPNLLHDTGYKHLLYDPMQLMSFMLLPIPIFFVVASSLFELSFIPAHEIRISEMLQTYIVVVFILLLLPVLFSLTIDIENAICAFIVSHILGGANQLTDMISTQVQIDNVHISVLTPFVQTFLRIALLISLLIMLLFFIIRFLLLWTLFLILPVVFIFRGIPRIHRIGDVVLDYMIQLLLIQPVFLLGLGVFFFLMQQPVDDLSRVLIGIMGLFALSLLPSFLLGLTGRTAHEKAQNVARNVARFGISRIGYGLQWLDETFSQPYMMPIEKPNKSKSPL